MSDKETAGIAPENSKSKLNDALGYDRNSIMVYLDGIDKPSFRCECGCNVFHHPVMPTWEEEMRTYDCNACSARYIGE